MNNEKNIIKLKIVVYKNRQYNVFDCMTKDSWIDNGCDNYKNFDFVKEIESESILLIE